MPVSGIDHIMVAVPELTAAVAALAGSLGLVATRGTEHPRFGTANRVVHIPGLYLELITIIDSEQALTWHVGRRIAEVNRDGGGLLAFVLGADDLPTTVADLTATGLSIDAPVDARSVAPDGTVRRFRLAGHGAEFEAGRLPSLIEPSPNRTIDPHPDDLGYELHGLVRVDVAVTDFAAGIDRYQRLLGVSPVLARDAVLDVDAAEFALPDGRGVRLLGLGSACREGLFGIALGVGDLDEAISAVSGRRGVAVKPTGIANEVLLDQSRTFNARISLVSA